MSGLVFSDTGNRQGLIQDCEDNLNFPAEGISNDTELMGTFTRKINIWYRKVVTMILDSQDGWDFDDANNTDYPIATAPLTATRDVTLPAGLNVLKIKRVDVTYDGSTYFKMEPFDSGMTGLGLGNDAETDGRFAKTKPYYDLVGSNGIFLYPMASAEDVASGASIRVEFYRDVIEFDIGEPNKFPGFDAPFHSILSLGASYDYAASKNLPLQGKLGADLQDMEIRLRRYYGLKDTDNQFTLTAAYRNDE